MRIPLLWRGARRAGWFFDKRSTKTVILYVCRPQSADFSQLRRSDTFVADELPTKRTRHSVALYW